MQLLFQQCAFDVTCIVALGKDMGTTGQDESFFHAWEALLGDLNFRFFTRLPLWLRRLTGSPALRRFDRALGLLDRTIYATIRSASPEEPSFLAAMLRERIRQQAAGETPLSDKQIRDHLLTLLLAAHDTTTNLMTFALYYVATVPGLDQRLSDELLEVVGDRSAPGDAHVPRLKLLKQVLLETLRLRPSAPLRGRTLAEDVEIPSPSGSFLLPRGSHVAWSAYSVHRLGQYWPDPERFDPSRFDEDAVKSRIPFTYIPFGAGPRRCIGEAFALREAAILIGTLLQHFHFALAPGTLVDDEFALTMRSRFPMSMIITNR